ncbi:hypothetical protein LCGC14_0731430 [marine sediment metagenome]|uniref:EamA domain-containing protein n=1 Tax=marine sediment metagenome TaxID=412755 RepID=A0A0F9TGP3_9ZZZZ
MWWILQIIAMICVIGAITFARWYGLNRIGLFVPWVVKVGVEFIAAFAFIKSYAIAPSFFQPWFLGSAISAILGCAISFIFFGEVLTITKIIGAALALAGAVLLIL